MQETVVSKGKSKVSLHFVWEMKRSLFKLVILASHQTLKKLSFKEVHKPCSRNDRGHIHEERRLLIEELDEWRAHKLRTHDKLKLRQNESDTSPSQLKVGEKVLLDGVDPHIVTTTPNEEIPLTVLSIFPFGTVEVSHPKFSTFKVPCHPQEERKPLYLLRRRGRERPLPRAQLQKSVTLSYNFLEGPRKNSVLQDYRADIPRAHDGTMLNIPSPDRNDKVYAYKISSCYGK
ncbi:hypothetical protein GOBAR_AA07691 [Gossypium barbadense]|uniref:Uncharacterized protein n=1 Tax=Gossypium barbadense TaxID=3634 RepID=A0A2P5YBK7_GOSBA|nr:hypothetical protein GOBAR_AA07691 [Gossypium barbadense]